MCFPVISSDLPDVSDFDHFGSKKKFQNQQSHQNRHEKLIFYIFSRNVSGTPKQVWGGLLLAKNMFFIPLLLLKIPGTFLNLEQL